MSITHTITKSWQSQTGAPINKAVVLTGNTELNLDFQIAGTTTNEQHPLAFTKTLLQSIYIQSDQNITLKTNSTSTPQDTITITANAPFQWDVNAGVTDPFGGNVTTLYVTNAGATAANVSIRCLTNG